MTILAKGEIILAYCSTSSWYLSTFKFHFNAVSKFELLSDLKCKGQTKHIKNKSLSQQHSTKKTVFLQNLTFSTGECLHGASTKRSCHTYCNKIDVYFIQYNKHTLDKLYKSMTIYEIITKKLS